MSLKSLFGHAVNFVFPPACAVCRRDLPCGCEVPLCSDCDPRSHFFLSEVLSGRTFRAGIKLVTPRPICTGCGEHVEDEGIGCTTCLSMQCKIRELRSLWLYTPQLERVIKTLKYRLERQLIEYFALELYKVFEGELIRGFSSKYWSVVIPVPSNREMLAKRGFSHMAMIVRSLSQHLGLKCDVLSLRSRSGLAPQARLSREDRAKTSSKRFFLKNNRSFRGQSVLLVDDILTTGLSVMNCTEVLHQSGARAVDVITIARSPLFRTSAKLSIT